MLNKQLKESKMQVQINANTIVNKGTYGTAYDSGIDAVVEARVKTGKRGRPAKAPAPVYYQTNDLFGRVPDVAPNNMQGRVIIGKASVNAVDAADDEQE
jgi:hypothetical protein